MEINRKYIKDRVISEVYSESVGDYVLPDYNGDVRKILFTKARVLPSGKFPSGDSVQFAGVVSYNVVYLDNENNVTHCDFTADYDVGVKCCEDTFRDADIDTELESYTVRLNGPRKFSVKAMLDSTVHILEDECIGCTGDALLSDEAELLTKDIKIRCSAIGSSDEREYAEELQHIDGVIADEVEVLYTDSEVKITSASFSDGSGEHKGEIKVTSLVKCGKEVPHLVEKSIPFEETFSFDDGSYTGELVSESVRSSLTVSSVRCNVVADEDGVGIMASVITDGKMRVDGNVDAVLVKDCFLTSSGCDNEDALFHYKELVASAECVREVASSYSRETLGCESVRNFLISDASVRVDDVKCLADSVNITGEVRFSGIACEITADGEAVYNNVKVNVPFNENVNISCHIPDGAKIECSASVSSPSLTLDAEGVMAECRVALSFALTLDRRESFIASSNKNDIEYENDDTLVSVYYPDENETLYDIAKKYHKSRLSIAGANALSESVFLDKSSPVSSLGVEKLIIR